MNGNHVIRVRFILAVVSAFVFLPSVSLRAAELRYIRIGEHKDYTRIVFEFRGAVAFEKPHIEGKGKAAIVFADTQTVLPKQILSETTKRVNAITFIPQQPHLAVEITFPFPYFEINAFSLKDPERVVLDVTETKTAPHGAISEKSIEKKAPRRQPEDVGAPKKPPENETASTPNPPLVEPMPAGLEKPTQPVQAAGETPSPAPPASSPPSVTGELKPVAEEQAGNLDIGMTTSETSGQQEPAAAVTNESALQAHLLIILVAVSIVIVALLIFIIFWKRKGHIPAGGRESLNALVGLDEEAGTGVAERDRGGYGRDEGDLHEGIAAIDAKIREALKRVEHP
jgi:hypothetical protein